MTLIWHDGLVSGDEDFCAAVHAAAGDGADAREVLFAATALVGDDGSFQIRGDVPDFDEDRLEQWLRRGPAST